MENTNVGVKSGLFISTKILIVIGILTALIFAGSILATYYGKSCPNCDDKLSAKCGDLYCLNVNIIDGILN